MILSKIGSCTAKSMMTSNSAMAADFLSAACRRGRRNLIRLRYYVTGKPLISVILLCYKHEKFVGDAVDGVLAQTYAPLEIVIIDDCSPDRTAEVIEARLAAHPARHDVRFIRNTKNMGGYAAAKKAIEMAKGAFVFIPEGDDVMLPQMVEEMAGVWRKMHVSLVTANAWYIDENSRPLNRTFRDPARPADDSFETLARDGSNACCFGPAIGFEREIYTTFGWPPEYLGTYDIMCPYYAYLLKGAKFVDQPLLKYRVHGANASLSLTSERATDESARLTAQERIHHSQLAHVLLMEEELARLCQRAPERYGPVGARIFPLLEIQLAEAAKRLMRTKRQIYELELAPKN
jgi:Glycosyl transferase family 2